MNNIFLLKLGHCWSKKIERNKNTKYLPETANKWVFLLFLVFILSLLFSTIIAVLRKKDKVFFFPKTYFVNATFSINWLFFIMRCSIWWIQFEYILLTESGKWHISWSRKVFFQTAFQNVCLHRLFSFYLNGNKHLPLLCPFINNELSLRRNDRLPNKNIWKKKTKYCTTFDHLREEIYSLLFGCSNRCCFHWTLFLVFYKVEIASYMISTKLRTKAFRLVNKHKYLALNVKNGHYFYVVTFESLSFFAKLTF